MGCVALPLSCGDAPERVDPNASQAEMPNDANHGGAGHAPADSEPLFFGQVRLTGELAKVTEGRVFVYARQPGTRIPTLIQHLEIPFFEQDGEDKVQAYELTSSHTMGGMQMEIPDTLELKIYFDPDGLVDTREGQEEIIVPTVAGQKRYDVTLHDGMDSADTAPSAFPEEEE